MAMADNKLNFKIERPLTDVESAAFKIVEVLQKAGFEAYFAGGAVRDELLNLPAHDIDIATSAKPEDVKKLFPNSRSQGKAFGVESVKIAYHDFEIATFRQDIGVADHRRPAEIRFSSAEQDAKRRDFTINGLFFDPVNGQIIDHVEGLKDIKRKLIRFIGEPQQRIEEDYLRMLRAVRFSCRLGFEIEEGTAQAIKENAEKIMDISAERVREETSKILLCEDRAKAIELMDLLGLLRQVLPEVSELKRVPQPKEFHSEGDVWTHVLLALSNIGQTDSEELVWTVLLHDIAKPETIGFRAGKNKTSITFFDHDIKSAEKAQEILERLKFSHHFTNNVTWAIKQHMRIVNAFRGMSERKQKKLFCDPNIQLLLDLTQADLSASLRQNHQKDMTMYNAALALREKFEKEASEEEKNQVKKFDLVTGNDIMEILKIPSGRQVGSIKSEIEKAYLDNKINTRQDAINMLEKYK
jgi:poly(A) polymerase